MMNKDYRSSFIDLLNDFEDALTAGFRRTHAPVGPAAPPSVLDRGSSEADAGEEKAAGTSTSLETIAQAVRGCARCRLSVRRNKAVPGEGVSRPLVMVIGEGPGAEEDRQGLPFVGRAGRYLDKWLEAIKLARQENAFIANIVKCRPPQNRDPHPDEMDACLPYLRSQIKLLEPRAILTLGRISSRILCGRDAGIGVLRGETYLYEGIPVIPTYHPSAVLRDPSYRPLVWEDLKRLDSLIRSTDG